MPPKISRIFPEPTPGGTLKITRLPRDAPTPPKDPKGCPRDPHKTQKEPQRPQKNHPKQPKMLQRTSRDTSRAQKNDHPKEPQLKKGNRSNNQCASTTTDTTLKQHCIGNDLGPAECAERLDNSSCAFTIPSKTTSIGLARNSGI